MDNSDPTSGGSPGNPVIVDIEATPLDVRADHALDPVLLEVRDDTGAGFRAPERDSTIRLGRSGAGLFHARYVNTMSTVAVESRCER